MSQSLFSFNGPPCIAALDITDAATARDVLALQRAAYQVEADLISYADLPPLGETLADVQGSGESFVGAFLGAALAGATSYKLRDGVCDIHRMMVHPGAFRRGIGRALLGRLREIAQEAGATRVIVSTGRDNAPGCALYHGFGFRDAGDEEVVPGLFITHFTLDLAG